LHSTSDKTVRVARLESEVQAQLLDAVLNDRGIPHVIRSYHDAALDGMFQSTLGWGHVEAPERCRAAVLEALRDLAAGSDVPDHGPGLA
jgi:hypothetical protein